jgi:hypothetical protein
MGGREYKNHSYLVVRILNELLDWKYQYICIIRSRPGMARYRCVAPCIKILSVRVLQDRPIMLRSRADKVVSRTEV